MDSVKLKIDKIAEFVARNGDKFEVMIREKQFNNPEFYFLRAGPYHEYYQSKVDEFKRCLVAPSRQSSINAVKIPPPVANRLLNDFISAVNSSNDANFQALINNLFHVQDESMIIRNLDIIINEFQNQTQYQKPVLYFINHCIFYCISLPDSSFRFKIMVFLTNTFIHLLQKMANIAASRSEKDELLKLVYPLQKVLGNSIPDEIIKTLLYVPQPIPELDGLDFPAGLMIDQIQFDQCNYEPIDPSTFRYPNPEFRSPLLTSAIEAFYSNTAQTDGMGWEEGALNDFYCKKAPFLKKMNKIDKDINTKSGIQPFIIQEKRKGIDSKGESIHRKFTDYSP